ncbi:MAG: hypothetical protein BWY09_01947 [Candidatus Hydrogenedentes bacterium ADurb.Bin179]|nr:MAG: hypothetical protein BWY09_01947 [Candidatus Hydrogenedentes bacterium ADurb.Bin179]
MGDGVGVPAFREHGYGYHTADRISETAFLANGVHHFPKQVLVADIFRLSAVAGAFDNFTPEPVYLIGGHFAKIHIQGVTGFKLLAVDEQRAGTGQLVPMFIKVAKQFETAIFQSR